MNCATSIYFVRHGLVHNPQAIAYGRLPGFHLNAEGRAQAQAAADALRDIPITALFTSPLERAQETAEIIHTYHPQATLHIAPGIIEIHSPYEGQPVDTLKALDWDTYSGAGPGYELPADILARVLTFIAETRRAYAGQHIVAVSHGDVIAFLTLWAKRLPITVELKRKAAHYPAYASISTLHYQDSACEMPAYSYMVPY